MFKIKKGIAVFMCVCLLFGLMVTSFTAQTTEDFDQEIQIPADDSDPDTIVSAEKWAQINDFMAQIDGSGISFRLDQNAAFLESNNLSLNPYMLGGLYEPDSYYMSGNIIYQNRDPLVYTWENDYLLPSCNHTIHTHGCALVSFTMALNMGFGNSYNPGQVNTYLDANNEEPDTFDNDWKDAYSITFCDKYTVGGMYTRAQIEQIIAEDMYLFQKGFIVCLVKGSSQHYVFACGFDDGAGLSIYIYDPWYPRNYHWLDTYYANGWTMTTARLFH